MTEKTKAERVKEELSAVVVVFAMLAAINAPKDAFDGILDAATKHIVAIFE